MQLNRAAGIDEREVFDADGRDFDWNQLDASFNAPSLFSARRLVEVRLPSGKPGRASTAIFRPKPAFMSSSV